MKYFKTHFSLILISFLLLLNLSIWYAAIWEDRGNVLKVAFLNIGQGDSIFIESPNGNKIMIDGGPPGSKTESELAKQLPFYDRTIDMIVVTNPDTDHYAGYLPIVDSYKIGNLMEPGTHSETATYQKFESTILEKHIPKILARRGMRIILDSKRKIYLTILFPDRDVSNLKINDGSIVSRLTYGRNSFLLQGDSTSPIEEYLVSIDGSSLKSDVLKAGHHGSRTSTSVLYVKTVVPSYAIISAGLNNRYGHPHQETINTLNKYHVQILKTYEKGTIVMKSDGEIISVK